MSYLELLNNASQVSSDVFGRIDRNLQNSLSLKQQAYQFEETAKQKAIQLAQSDRVNEANIANIYSDNARESAKFEMEKSLFPLKVENERLRMASEQERSKAIIKQNNAASFAPMVSSYDSRIAELVARNKDPELLKGYNELKMKAQNDVAQFGKFDNEGYGGAVENLITSRSTFSTPTIGYDPILGAGIAELSTPQAKAYEFQNNDSLKRNRNLLAAMAVTQDKEAFMKTMGVYSDMFEASEAAQLSIGNDIYASNQNEIKRHTGELSKLYANRQNFKDDPELLKRNTDYITLIESKANALVAENERIVSDFALGKFEVTKTKAKDPTITEEEKAAAEVPKQKAALDKLTGATASKERPFNMDISADDESGKKRGDRAKKVIASIGENKVSKSIFENVDASWFQKNNKQEGADDLRSVQDFGAVIQKNVESLRGLNMNKIEGYSEKLIATIDNDTFVPISDYVYEAVKGTELSKSIKTRDGANGSTEKVILINPNRKSGISGFFMDAGSAIGQTGFDDATPAFKAVTSYSKDMRKALEGLPEEKRMIVAREIFSAVATGAMVNSLRIDNK